MISKYRGMWGRLGWTHSRKKSLPGWQQETSAIQVINPPLRASSTRIAPVRIGAPWLSATMGHASARQ